MSDAITQDHERTVMEARSGMNWHDSGTPLRRWFYNYKDDKGAFWWNTQWCVVTREGNRWKIETGEYGVEKPCRTLWADPHAPAPPIFEFRPPPPEPVKPRFQVPEPRIVPSYARGSYSYAAAQMMQAEIRRRLGPLRVSDRILQDMYAVFMDRPTFDRVTAPPPPPPSRRNQ